jgi:tetratricopeptide (TPR) repeat protein
LPAREGSVQDRRQGLQDGLANRRDNIGQGTENRQDWREGNRDDWQDHWDNNHWNHGWYSGCWHGANYPGAWWAVASWTTPWYGSWWYANPYATTQSQTVYNYSEPIVVYQTAPQADAAAPNQPAAATSPPVSDEGMKSFDAAREAFASGDYKKALDEANQALKSMPNDAVVHEFRALVLFAQQNYREAAAADYAVLSAGPGWDWTTMSSLYGDASDYEKQLRALEAYTGKNPKSADAHFLLAYHYMTAGHAEAAADQLKQVKQLLPDDKLAGDLLKLVTPAEDQPPPDPATPAKSVAADQLVGSWAARGTGDSQFAMTLDKDGKFTWQYTRGKTSQSVSGVYAVDEATLALEPDSGGKMLADVALEGGKLKFRMAGGDASDPALEFAKAL